MEMMKDEFTEKMHAELSVSRETEIKHKALCVWTVFKNRYKNQSLDEDEQEKVLTQLGELYEVSYADVMRHQEYN